MFSGQNIGIMVLTVVLNNGNGLVQWIGLFVNVVKGRIILLKISLGSPEFLLFLLCIQNQRKIINNVLKLVSIKKKFKSYSILVLEKRIRKLVNRRQLSLSKVHLGLAICESQA